MPFSAFDQGPTLDSQASSGRPAVAAGCDCRELVAGQPAQETFDENTAQLVCGQVPSELKHVTRYRLIPAAVCVGSLPGPTH